MEEFNEKQTSYSVDKRERSFQIWTNYLKDRSRYRNKGHIRKRDEQIKWNGTTKGCKNEKTIFTDEHYRWIRGRSENKRSKEQLKWKQNSFCTPVGVTKETQA